MNLAYAIMQLFPGARPGVDFAIQDDGEGPYIREWHLGDPLPTPEALAAAWEAAAPREAYDNALVEAQRARAAAYPPIGDQLDALWKGGEAAAAMLAQVQAVKAAHPKP